MQELIEKSISRLMAHDGKTWIMIMGHKMENMDDGTFSSDEI